MKIDILKQPAATILLAEAALLAVGVGATIGEREVVAAATPTAEAVESLVGGSGSLFGAIVAALLVFINSLLAARIVTRYSVSVVRSFVPMVLFTIAATATSVQTGSIIPQLTATLLLTGSSRLIRSFKRSLIFAPLFEGYFLIGIIPLLYPNALPVVALSLLMMAIYERTPREWVAGMAGALLPTLLCAWLWWLFAGVDFGTTLADTFGAIGGERFRLAELFTLDRLPEGVMLAFMTLIVLLAVVSLVVMGAGMRTRPKKINWHFTLIVVSSLLMLLLDSPSPYFYALFASGFAVIAHLFFARWPHIATLIAYLLLLILGFGAMLL